MQYVIQQMTQANALTIANDWKYDGEYAFYDMTADPEDYAEFVDESARWKNDFYEVLCDGDLCGYFCVERGDSDIEIGLGLRPDLCGHGTGRSFVTQILDFASTKYVFDRIVLNVALFNQRAIKVYRACGFVDVEVCDRATNGGIYPFLCMQRVK